MRGTHPGIAVVVATFLAVIAAVMGIALFALDVLASARAYVGGEGLWSKAEKDAAAALTRYITDGEEAAYEEFRRQLAVPLGDRRAREELDRPDGDLVAAREGFLRGRNHPEDVEGMMRLFRRFRRVEPLDGAIGIWKRGDDLIAELEKLGERVHAEGPEGTREARQEARRQVEIVNARATLLEDEFSATLSAAARRVRTLVQNVLIAMTALLVALAIGAAARVGRLLHLQEDSLRASASHDALTRLPNRVLFSDRLTLAIRHARRQRAGLAVMFLDLDHFKRINDGLGHAAGDEVLVAVAERLRACLRGDDTVARLGGDEFIFLVPDVMPETDVGALACKILARVAEPLTVAGRQVQLTASLGIGIFPDDGEDAETLVSRVDAAMYRAKERGRNNFQFFASPPAGSGKAG